jgi:hypothetical protein
LQLVKYGLVILSLILPIQALEITVKPSDSIKVDQVDVDRFQSMLKKRRMGMSDKSAKKAIKENRILANAYMKEYGLPDLLKIEMQIILEEKLRNTLIKKEKKKIDISDDILLSYYKDNPEEFYQSEELTFNVYTFKQYDDAHEFYVHNKDAYSQIADYVAEHNVSNESHTMLKSKLHKELQPLLKDDNVTNYITPPEYFYKNYVILDVVSIQEAKIAPFETVKKRVRERLLSKITQETKDKLLEKYSTEDGN